MNRAVAPSWMCLVAMQIASIVLPRPGGPISASVRACDEGGVQVAQHDLTLELGTEAEVELLDRGCIRKAGLTQPFGSSGVGPRDALLLEQTVQEVGVAELLARRTVEPIWQHRRRLTQAQLLQQRFERRGLQPGGHQCTSPFSTSSCSWSRSCCTSSAQT